VSSATLSDKFKKNCDVAEFKADVRAMAMVPRTLLKPLPTSSGMGERTTCATRISGAKHAK
jgi:hypothetical protein